MKQPNLKLTYLIQDLAKKLGVKKERLREDALKLAHSEERETILRRHVVDAANTILQGRKAH